MQTNGWTQKIPILEVKQNLVVVAIQGASFLLQNPVSLQVFVFFSRAEPISKAS